MSYEEDIPTPGLSEVTETKEEESRPPKAQKRTAGATHFPRAAALPVRSASPCSEEGKALARVSGETDRYTFVAFFVLEKKP